MALCEQENLTRLSIICRPDLTTELTHLTVNKSDGCLFYWSLTEAGVNFKKMSHSDYAHNMHSTIERTVRIDLNATVTIVDKDIESLSDGVRQKLTTVDSSNTKHDNTLKPATYQPRPIRARWTLGSRSELEFMVNETEVKESECLSNDDPDSSVVSLYTNYRLH